MYSNEKLKIIFNNTFGHCHFCGDPLNFEKYGCKEIENIEGAWEADHIHQKAKGGRIDESNCLPACVRCNRLRWHRKGNELREVILLGLIAKKEIKKNSIIGKQILELKSKRLQENKKRRRKILN
jgi:5-methylcytosine-specific restriction endonuclease McrA